MGLILWHISAASVVSDNVTVPGNRNLMSSNVEPFISLKVKVSWDYGQKSIEGGEESHGYIFVAR